MGNGDGGYQKKTPRETQKETRRGSRRGWLWVILVGMVLASGLLVFYLLWRVPYDAARGGREALESALDKTAEIARAFHSGTITTTFLSYATEVRGTTSLQVATLSQREVFERKDEATTFWGTLALPDVVVRATAPVEYTYTLDLEREWLFDLRGHVLHVTTPPLRFNKPAVDVSQIQFEVSQDSLLRDTDAARENLRRGITPMVHRRARENIPLVREVARRQTQHFVEHWLTAQFGDADDYTVEVTFRDELPGALMLPGPSRELPPPPE
jgi:hypothetical protein